MLTLAGRERDSRAALPASAQARRFSARWRASHTADRVLAHRSLALARHRHIPCWWGFADAEQSSAFWK